MKKYIMVLVSLLALFEVTTTASENVLQCNDCGYNQREAAARQFVIDYKAGHYDIYVADISSKELTRFSVMIFSEPGMRSVRIRSVMPSVEMQDGFNHLLSVHKEFELYKTDYDATDLPSDFDVQSAFDLVGNLQAQRAVSNYLRDNFSGWFYLSNLWSSVLGIFNQFLSSQWEWVVKFPDGSYASFTSVTFGVYELEYTYNKGESVDSEGNSIPEQSQNFVAFQGTFSNTTSLADWLEHARRYGISIVDQNDKVLKNVKVECFIEGTKIICIVKPK
jgi:hypothetical protein